MSRLNFPDVFYVKCFFLNKYLVVILIVGKKRKENQKNRKQNKTHTHKKNKKETNKPNSRTGGNSWPSLDGIFHLIVVLLGKVSYLDKITSYLFNILGPLKPGFVEFLSLKLQRHSEPHHYKYLVDSMVQFLYSFQFLEPFFCQGFLS